MMTLNIYFKCNTFSKGQAYPGGLVSWGSNPFNDTKKMHF